MQFYITGILTLRIRYWQGIWYNAKGSSRAADPLVDTFNLQQRTRTNLPTQGGR
jgi:hypothetical protein